MEDAEPQLQLERLSRQCEALKQKQEHREEVRKTKAKKKENVKRLESKRASLKAQLQRTTAAGTTLQDKLAIALSTMNAVGTKKKATVARKASYAQLASVVTNRRARRQQAALGHAYRLAGRTTFSVGDENLIGVCLDTSSPSGAFLEPYYVVMQLTPLAVHKHTMPYFVPVTSIAEARLGVSLQSFLDEISDYLQAYVMRREQLHNFKEAHPEIGLVEFTTPIDYVEISNTSLDRYVRIQLAYDDLKQILPQRAVVLHSSSSANPDDAIREAVVEADFKQADLLQVFDAFMATRDAEDL